MTLRENLAGCKFSFSKPKVDVGLEYACRPSKNSFYLCPSDHIEVGTLWGSISQQLIQQLDPYILSTYLLRYALPVPRRSRMRSPSKLKDLQKNFEDACLFFRVYFDVLTEIKPPRDLKFSYCFSLPSCDWYRFSVVLSDALTRRSLTVALYVVTVVCLVMTYFATFRQLVLHGCFGVISVFDDTEVPACVM
uniref:Uncharacterized protein n=1 Tax=Schistocephalus solidus TaxID=70667 RepID=A0A0X3NFM9_SCHSO